MLANTRLRDKIRDNLNENRKIQRGSFKDQQRCGLGLVADEIKVTVEEVQKLCNRIKRRKIADQIDIYRLSQGFLRSSENITAFLMNQGAINVLIKELTGSSGEKQILAAESICNLSLGDPVCCTKIANLTGSYLLLLSTSGNTQVARTILWTLYNLIAESPKALNFLLDQKLILKLLSLLEGNYDQDLKSDATRCLSVVLADEKFNDKRTEDMNKIVNTAVKSWNEETPRLLFQISRGDQFPRETAPLIFSSIIHYLSKEDLVLSTAQQLYSIRTLVQLMSSPSTIIHPEQLQSYKEEFVTAFNRLFQTEDPVFKETIFFLGIFLKDLQTQSDKFEAFIEEIFNRLIVPRKPEFEFNQCVQASQKMDSN